MEDQFSSSGTQGKRESRKEKITLWDDTVRIPSVFSVSQTVACDMGRLMDLQLIYREARLGRFLGKTEEGNPVCASSALFFST